MAESRGLGDVYKRQLETRSRKVIDASLADIKNSFIVEDFDGMFLKKYQMDLQKSGFDINVINFTKEDLRAVKYNPFVYIKNEEDAYLLANSIIENTTVVNTDTKPDDDFWRRGDEKLLERVIAYECLTKQNNNINFRGLIDALKDEEKIKEVIKGAQMLESMGPKTMCSIISNCIIRLSNLSVLDENIRYEANNVNLNSILDNKSATFIIYPADTQFYKALTNIMYSQLYSEAVKKKEEGKEMSPLTLFINEKSDSYKIRNLTNILFNAKNLNLRISLNINNVESFLDKYRLGEVLSIFDQLIIFRNDMSEKTAKEIQDYITSNFDGEIFDSYENKCIELTTDDLKSIKEDETIFLNRANKIALKYKI